MTRAVSAAVSIPVVASGGAGSPEHLFLALTEGRADAALAASIFHYDEYGIRATKAYLAERGGPVRLTDSDSFRRDPAGGPAARPPPPRVPANTTTPTIPHAHPPSRQNPQSTPPYCA